MRDFVSSVVYIFITMNSPQQLLSQRLWKGHERSSGRSMVPLGVEDTPRGAAVRGSL